MGTKLHGEQKNLFFTLWYFKHPTSQKPFLLFPPYMYNKFMRTREETEQAVWHTRGSLKILSAGNAFVNMIPKRKCCVDNKKFGVTFMRKRNINLFTLLSLEPVGYLSKGLILEQFFLKKRSIKPHNLLPVNSTILWNNVTELNYSEAPECKPKLQWTFCASRSCLLRKGL